MAKGLRVIDGGRGAGCGFLTEIEIDAYLSGQLDSERTKAFSAGGFSDALQARSDFKEG